MANDLTSAAITAAAKTTKETIGAQIVSGTLDTLNKTAPGKKGKSNAAGNMATSYDFNKSVLSAAYNPTGAIADLKS